MPPDRHYLESALSETENTVRFLKGLAAFSEAEFLADLRNCLSACYALLTAIEGTANVAAHLLTRTNQPAPRGMAQSFEALFRMGALTSAELRDNLVQMTRFRNLLVHRYWELDYRRIYGVLQEHLGDFARFAAEVMHYLDGLPPEA